MSDYPFESELGPMVELPGGGRWRFKHLMVVDTFGSLVVEGETYEEALYNGHDALSEGRACRKRNHEADAFFQEQSS